jgi:cytochrome c oxidase subunit II
MSASIRIAALVGFTPVLGWAASVQDSMRPAGPQAVHIYGLWEVMLWTCIAVTLAILLAVVIALLRAPRSTSQTAPDVSSLVQTERKARNVVIAAVALSLVGLLGLILASVLVDRALAQLPLRNAVNVEVTAHQWWWEIRYQDEQPSRIFTTANEMHVPIGRPVLVTLKSDDVIHSFWVPNLHGKKDLIPGRTSTIRFRADEPGVYRGQCAEFCGYQHANMSFLVIAEPEDQFEKWADAQRQSPPAPTDPIAERGKQVFLTSTCAMCHAVQGTPAGGQKGPDLTHVASRRTLAAGTIPNNAGYLAGWIVDPQRIKPGVNMPQNSLPAEDLQALLAYLSTLQ